MPRALSRTIEARRIPSGASVGAVALGLALSLACSPPNAEDLYAPLSGGSGGAEAGTAGAGRGGSAGGGAAGSAGAAGTAAGGQGGQGGAAAGASGGGTGGAGGTAGAPGDPSDAGTSADSGSCALRAEACNGLDDDCDGVADPAGTCADGCQGFALGARGYMFCAETLDRPTALARCSAAQMNLTWIESSAENAALVDALAALGVSGEGGELLVQIGASDAGTENAWVWVGNAVVPDGFPFWEGRSADDGGDPVDDAFQSWGEGEPNDDNGGEDCAVLSVLGSDERAPGEWDDRSCDTGTAFVCEAP